MIHTFEFAKEITEETYEQIIAQFSIPYRRQDKEFRTNQFSEQGLQMVRLRKKIEKSNRIHYMVYIAVNPGKMFHGDPHLPLAINTFTPDFMQAIYLKIFEAIPFLEVYADVRLAMEREAQLIDGHDSHYEKWYRLKDAWGKNNAFNANRIDFAYDISFYPQEYEKLLARGYPSRQRQYLRLNIYNKKREITDLGLSVNPDTDYNFLRFEVQTDKGKLYAIEEKLKKSELPGLAESQSRELFYLVSPEIEEYLLIEYLEEIAGRGFYVTNSLAMEIIDDSSYSDYDKDKMKAVIKEVRNRHGIAKMLELVKDKTITDLGKVSTVKKYLALIHGLGINPVTISDRMNAPVLHFRNSNGDVVHTGRALPNLADVIKVYSQKVKEEQQNGPAFSEEDWEQIAKL